MTQREDAAPDPLHQCPHCGATNQQRKEQGEACGVTAEKATTSVARKSARKDGGTRKEGPAAQANNKPPGAGFSLSLSTFMIAVTLVSLLAALAPKSLGLAIVMAILLLPATLRSGLQYEQQNQRGRKLSFRTRSRIFLSSVGVILIISFLAVGAPVCTYLTGEVLIRTFDLGSLSYDDYYFFHFIQVATSGFVGLIAIILAALKLLPFRN